MRTVWIALIVALGGACAGDRPKGLMAAPVTEGPKVMFDLDAKPLPEIPLPNDLATRPDPASPTGRRVNISLDAPTNFERNLRQVASHMDGFGTFAPFSVRFDAPLDIANIMKRQRQNKDYADDVVLVVNLTPGQNFGELVPLDFGHGNFPLTVADMNRYWTNDQRKAVPNLLYDTTDEDTNHNGKLDPGEDTDGDGYLDVPNVYPSGGDPVDDVLAFYEKVTNTLIFRPIFPMRQENLYAVVLTKNLIGENGQPIRSAFPFINHVRQTEVLKDLGKALEMNGFRLDDVAFTWAFTTQGTTRDLEVLRRGVYGNGPFARLSKEFPPEATMKPMVNEGEDTYKLTSAKLNQVVQTVLPFLFGSNAGVDVIIDSFRNIDYVVQGSFRGPNFLADKDGLATPGYPADDDEYWLINRKTGEAYYKPMEINFWCAIPKKDRGNGPPFPVTLYMHGHTSTRFDMLGYAGMLGRYGIASCAISAFGHGLVIPEDLRDIAEALMDGLKVRPTIEALAPDRARDLDNDGEPDSGVDYWTSDMFHTRDMVRQTTFDQMMLIRLLRSFDGQHRSQQDLNRDGQPDLAGDFDGDGVVDIGGPDQDYFAYGHSLGGIQQAVLAGIEPALTAAVPICFAGGLADVGLRCARFGVPETAILRVLGPLYVGVPGDGNKTQIRTIVPTLTTRRELTVLETDVIAPGDRIRIENTVNGEHFDAWADASRRFRGPIPASALNSTEKRALLKLPVTPAGEMPPAAPDTRLLGDTVVIKVYDGTTGDLKATFDKFEQDVVFEGVTYPQGAPLVALTRGMGMQRNTPRFRRLFGNLAQAMVDPGDPINYAPHYFKEPLHSVDYDSTEPGVNVLLIPTLGDPGVSVGTGIAGARAAGLIDIFSVDPRYGKSVNDVLIDNYIIEGLSWLRRFDGREVLMDPEDLSQGRWRPDVPRLDPPLRLTKNTGRGLSALRLPLLDPRGQHCFGIPEPDRAFDNNTFLITMMARYFQTRGREIREELCMEDLSCSWIPEPSPKTQ